MIVTEIDSIGIRSKSIDSSLGVLRVHFSALSASEAFALRPGTTENRSPPVKIKN